MRLPDDAFGPTQSAEYYWQKWQDGNDYANLLQKHLDKSEWWGMLWVGYSIVATLGLIGLIGLIALMVTR